MMKKRTHSFIKEYWELSVVVCVGVVGGVLALTGFGEWARGLITLFSIAIALQLGWGMVKTLRSGQFGVDILAITAILSTAAVGQYWATLVIVLMLVGGEALEDYANRRAKQELTALMERAPTKAYVLRDDGTVEEVRVGSVKVGQTLVLRPGDVVPVDARIVKGGSMVDESSLTGESLPVEKKKGDELLSGTVNGDSVLTVTVIRTAEKSQYTQIVELVKAAADSRAPFVRMADRYAVPFTLVAFVIAGIAWWLSGDPVRFAEVLVVATPCPLLIAAPVALISGMSRAARHGIIVKNGGILERLAKVRTAVFDKTGTLTTGVLAVDKLIPAKGITRDDLALWAASAESRSSHILAGALMAYVAKQGLSIPEPTRIKEAPGQGVSAMVAGTKVLVGRRQFLEAHHISMTKVAEPDTTSMYVARDGAYVGVVTFSDEVRSNSKATISRLHMLGIRKTVMLTGDMQRTAQMVASTLGIRQVYAECLPVDKLTTVKAMYPRPVLMVGDGVNDAPVLSAADVGIAMGAKGATAASESADVVILLDDISKVEKSIVVARDTMRIALQSVWIGIIISVALMLVAASGHIPAIVGAGLQELVDVIVIINALRAHGSFLPK